jgi:hypothetical protein
MVADLPFDPSTVDLDALLKRLHLANARRAWPQLCERAEAEQWSCRDRDDYEKRWPSKLGWRSLSVSSRGEWGEDFRGVVSQRAT